MTFMGCSCCADILPVVQWQPSHAQVQQRMLAAFVEASVTR